MMRLIVLRQPQEKRVCTSDVMHTYIQAFYISVPWESCILPHATLRSPYCLCALVLALRVESLAPMARRSCDHIENEAERRRST